MARGTGRLAAAVRTLRKQKVWELGGLFSPWLVLPESFGHPKRRRLFSPWRTFWLFLSQVLSADKACREVVRGFLAWLAFEGKRAASPRTAAYCKARRRLRLRGLQGVHGQVCRALQATPPKPRDLWLGRRVKVADGSALSMPDTAANQRIYPQSPRAKPGCGFPIMRIVAIFSLATGALLDLAKGALRVHERTLFRKLWHLLEPGDVLLADCGFPSYADFYCLSQRGVDCVMGNHPRRSVGLTVLRTFSKGDRLLAWHKTGSCPDWLSHADWAAMPDRLPVREIRFSVDVPGFRTSSITIATTLLDPEAYPKDAFADLYRRRWMAELYLRDIKTSLGMDILRCKTPAMVHRELLMFQIAYNLVRGLMVQAAATAGIPTYRISFKGSVATVRQWAPVFVASAPSQRKTKRLFRTLLSVLARDPVPNRPNRNEPRARKRRPKNYQLLNKPRRLFKEIQHRNRYRKALC
ncbi:MAG: IS4 family transposase [Planctomycetes bacterium]|nr:IS4 family transposase [Planctomycetota bacterium]